MQGTQDRQLRPCKLALADGTVVTGHAIGHVGEAGGELCFNTSMTGYQEIITDPSYHGQIMMIYLAMYAVTRFFIEFVRGDAGRGTVFGGLMSTSQFISVLILAASISGYLWLARRRPATG